MKITNDDALAPFRAAGRCDSCGCQNAIREPHHVTAKGQGGGRQLDHAINIAALCPALGGCGHACHHQHHSWRAPTRRDLEAAVAKREGLPVEDIEDAKHIVLSLPKAARCTQRDVRVALAKFEASDAVSALVRRVLNESGVEL